MGLEEAAVQWTWLVGSVAILAAAGVATLEVAETMQEAAEARHERQREKLLTSLVDAVGEHDAAGATFTLSVVNGGPVPLDLDAFTLLVDGVARPEATATLDEAPASRLWTPGSRATFTVPSQAAAPARVLLASRGGFVETLVADGPVSAGAPGDVHFGLGANAGDAQYVKSMRLSADERSVGGTFKPKNGAGTFVSDVLRVTNDGASAASATLVADPVANPYVKRFTWAVRNGTTTAATLDYLAASPTATFTLGPGESFLLDVRLDFRDGSGKDNAAFPFRLALEGG